MDGAPVRGPSPPPFTPSLPSLTLPALPLPGETIPIRLFLGGFELTPTFRDVNKKFSTRYYLNLVLIDEENRRYFKQQEITVYRQDTREETGPSGPAEIGQNLEDERAIQAAPVEG